MYRKCDAVVDGNIVYVINCSSKWIYLYDIISDSWSHDRPPDCVHENSSITTINGWLTTVGGGTYTNELFSLTVWGGKRIWTKKFPPMPTKRRSTSALCTETTLIVAGGEGQSGTLSTVEVMDTQTRQWSTAADLPQPMFEASATICGDELYLLGETNCNTQSLYVCLVRDLQSRISVHDQLQLATSKITNQPSKVWSQIVDVPVKGSTCESFYGRLLVIGGSSSDERFSRAIYMYDSAINSWEIISHMTVGRCECFTAVLPDNRLMVVGGWTDGGKLTKMVELASVCE